MSDFNALPSIKVAGVGYYAPDRVLTNADLSEMVDTSDEWIRTRTGISERRLSSDDQCTSDLATEAARKAMASAGVAPEEIDVMIVASVTPDMPFPSTACITQAKLGLRTVPCFDVQAACSGFIYALEVASNLLRGGGYRTALVIGAETLSSITDWEDRATCVLFGDGSGAAVLQVSDQPGEGLRSIRLGADGRNPNLLYLPAGGSAKPASHATVDAREHYLKMNGKEVFKLAVRAMEQAARDILASQNLSPDDIALVIPHQANTRIIDALSARLEIPMERFFINLERYGNTSAASIPIALGEAAEMGRLQAGQNILLVGFGAGLTWAAALIRWS